MKLLRGFVLLGSALPAFAQYAGPAILSRGEAPAAMASPKVDFSFSIALTANYTTGLAGVSQPNSQGELANASSYGGGVTLGVNGSHSWKKTHLGINYSGSFTDYANASYFAGLSQGLSIGLDHQLSRHIGLSVRENAGIFSQFTPGTVALNSSIPFDPSQSVIPTTDFYDNRTIYETSQVNLTVQKTSRLSFDFGGSYFLTVRRSDALFGAQGISATSDVQYRTSRRTTLGGGYSFTHYTYPNTVGGADIHTAIASIAIRLNRWTEISIFGGASRVESSFQQSVPIDPNILLILCPPSSNLPCPVTAGTVINHSVLGAPNFGARISRSFHRGVAFVNAGESITPGNGLFLTSRSLNVGAGYGYSGLRKWSMNLGVTYTSALSFGNVTGTYGQITGSYGLSRQLLRSLSFVSSLSATQYQSPDFHGYNRLIYSASIGLGFSSKNIPVRFF